VSQKIIAHHFFYVNYLIKLVNFTLVNFVCCKSQFFMSVGSISWWFSVAFNGSTYIFLRDHMMASSARHAACCASCVTTIYVPKIQIQSSTLKRKTAARKSSRQV